MVSICEGDALAACGSFAFARAVVEDCPYSSRDSLIERAREIWWTDVRFSTFNVDWFPSRSARWPVERIAK